MANWQYEKGLHETGNGIYSYLQPDGSWGWSNAGLIVDGDQSLLVDTLFDAPLTKEMLLTMQDAAGISADRIDTVVNTHANGDHTHGNGLCTNAEVIASEASAKEMEALGPQRLYEMMQAAPGLGETGKYFLEIFGSFDFGDIAEKLPTKTFSGEMQLSVGDKRVDLVEVGPAHTQGDVLVFVPDDSTVFTGDILFIDGQAVKLELPAAVEVSVVEAPEGIRGDTASNVQKPVTIDTGMVVQVPLFIKKGEKIRMSTADGSYLGRVSGS